MRSLSTLAAPAFAFLPAAVLPVNAPTSELPVEGSKAADFTLQSQEGKTVSLKDLRGQWVVLYFYPKDMTQGCTIEAHNFERDLDSHQQFCTKESLIFKLLADSGEEMISSYRSLAANGAVAARNTFLIDPAGVICKVYTKVNPNPHSQEVLEALTALEK